jgi:hypothetical protein
MISSITNTIKINFSLIVILSFIAPIYLIAAKLLAIGIQNLYKLSKSPSSFIYKNLGDISMLFPLDVKKKIL